MKKIRHDRFLEIVWKEIARGLIKHKIIKCINPKGQCLHMYPAIKNLLNADRAVPKGIVGFVLIPERISVIDA